MRPRATWANACGAFAVSRLLCAPEYPTWTELQYLPRARQQAPGAAQGRGAQPHPLGDDAPRATSRSLMALAIDHRTQLEDIADEPAPTPARIRAFKVLAVKAAAQVADGRAGFGMLLDDKYGRDALFEFAGARDSPGSAGRSNCRARGRCASSSARISARSWSNGRSTTASSACASITPTIRPS